MSAVGDYVIQHEIGSGAMAHIHMAYKKSTRARCCVKVIDKRTIEDSQDMRHLHNEVRLLSELNHPNIVKYIDFLDDTTNFYIFQEFIEGRSLLEMINETNGLSEEICHRLFTQLVSVLSYMHDRSVYHRDIKPENIIITTNNHLKLIDFGLSSISRPNELLTTFCGSVHYAAPEALMRRPYNGGATDIWSSGVVLYAMLTGDLPWNMDNVTLVVKKIITGDFQIPTFISPPLVNMMSEMLTLDPEARITAKQLESHRWIVEGPPTLIHIPSASYTESSSLPEIRMSPVNTRRQSVVRPRVRNGSFELHSGRGTGKPSSPIADPRAAAVGRRRSFDNLAALEKMRARARSGSVSLSNPSLPPLRDPKHVTGSILVSEPN